MLWDDLGVGRVLDDDPAAHVVVDDLRVMEGNTGTANAVITLRLSSPAAANVSLAWATATTGTGAGFASAGGDYTTRSGTVTINAGASTATITVPVVGDATDEADDETFAVNLSGLTGPAVLVDDQVVISIRDDD